MRKLAKPAEQEVSEGPQSVSFQIADGNVRQRSLRGCRAGCRQSCQDQKKHLSLHGEQMLPRHRCSLLAEKPTGVFVYRPSGFVFRGGRCRTASRVDNLNFSLLIYRNAAPSPVGDHTCQI
jgi:hypothetical protein